MKCSTSSSAPNVRADVIVLVAVLVFTATNAARAQVCPPAATIDPTTGTVEGLVSSDDDGSQNSVVAFDGLGRFAAAWKGPFAPVYPYGNDLFVLRFDAAGVCICCPDTVSAGTGQAGFHRLPSIDINADGEVLVGWLAHGEGLSHFTLDVLHTSRFNFDVFNIPGPVTPAPDPRDYEPSVAIAGGQTPSTAMGWSNNLTGGEGLLFQVSGAAEQTIRSCDDGGGGNICFVVERPTRPNAWQPAVAQRASDGVSCVIWGEAENPVFQQSPFNIVMQLYRADGTTIGAEVPVNVPGNEIPFSTQKSPAIAFDDTGSLVAVWTGPPLNGCQAARHIFARRFQWDGVLANAPVPVSDVFQVDSDPDAVPLAASIANPTVALTSSTDPALQGSFVIAWNAQYTPFPERDEIRAQYFNAHGSPIAGEFRLNLSTAPVNPGGDNFRRLGRSASHTLDYGPGGAVVATWTTFDGNSNPIDVHFTLLPDDRRDQLEAAAGCCKGDVTDDGLRDGLDIQPFVSLLIDPSIADPCLSIVENYAVICAADMNGDGAVAMDDVPIFVAALLEGNLCTGGAPRGGMDCNGNGIPDANDIADCDGSAWCGDCNNNFIPDECDIALCLSGDTSCRDLNANGIPDGCEPDCNGNDIPDDKDIADATSQDVNGNGIPDECDLDCNANGIPDDWDIDPTDPDGNGQVSADCNANGRPDECEADCNANGVPDDCDIDPTDPDGNGQVSPDCNENGEPDECDLSRPLFPSLDCNDNLIPDECDLATCVSSDPSCQDCNENGFLDGCDIASGISQDADANGVPDECEQQQAHGGGGESSSAAGDGQEDPAGDPPAGEPDFPSPEAESRAWANFYDWCLVQDWGPTSDTRGSQRFAATIAKLRELGLPARNPWLVPVSAR